MVQARIERTTVPVIMVIDASGSMFAVADDVCGGFNQYVRGLAADVVNTYTVSLYLFNTDTVKVHGPVAPSDMLALSDETYHPMGGTALYDALGTVITEYVAGEGERPLVVVHTDGKENSSREWHRAPLAALIEARTKEGWGFVYLGAGIDTWEGDALGMSSGMTVNSSLGTRGAYAGMTVGTVAYAAGATTSAVTETAGQWSRRAEDAAKNAK